MNGPAVPALDRTAPPPPHEVRSFTFPAFESHCLSNGLRVIVAPSDRTPLVDIELVTPAGCRHDPTDRPGLAHLTAAVQDEGTETRTSAEIARTVEDLGGYLSTGVSWETAHVNCGLLSKDLSIALELIADVAAQPSFPDREVDRLRQQTLAEIERRKTQPAAVANEELLHRLYGTGIYGYPLIGAASSVADLKRHHLLDFYQRTFSPADSLLIAVGTVEARELTAQLETTFATWSANTAPKPPAIEPLELGGIEINIVHREEAAQTELRMGHAGLPRNHPDYLIAGVMNSLFGGKFMSRINLNLRERRGYTYGAFSSFAKRSGPGPFTISAAVATEHTADSVREILGEIERLQNEPVGTEELAETKSYLIGTFPYGTQTLDGISARLYDLAVFGLPEDYYATYPDAIGAVTTADIQRCAQQHLSADRIAVVAVGPETILGTGLEALGPVCLVGDRD